MREKLIVPLQVCLGLVVGAVLGASPAPATCNTAPTAVDDAASAFEEAVPIDVLANDSDAEGQALTVTVDSTTCSASVSVDFDLVTLTPTPRITGDCTVTYTATDEGGLASSATVNVSIVSGIFTDGFESGDTLSWSQTNP